MAALFTCLSTLAPGTTHADEAALALLYGDEESVSIATGSSKPLRLAPSVATVITSDEIKESGAMTLDEILESVPGLHVSQSLNRLNSIYSIRGIHTAQNPQVLMLMDGVPITDMITGGRPVTFRLPVAAIERVEIIRGPGSAVYGADAFAGVINVISKNAAAIEDTSFGVRTGSFDTRNAWVQHATKLADWDLGVTLEWLKSEGDRDRVATGDLQTLLDGVFGTNASLAPGPLETAHDVINGNLVLENGPWRVGWWTWWQDKAGVGPGGAQAIDPGGFTDVRQHLFDLRHNVQSDSRQWNVTTELSYHYQDQSSHFNVLPAGTVVPIGADGNVDFASPVGVVSFPGGLIGNPGATDRKLEFSVTGVYSGFDNHQLRINAGVKRQKTETNEKKNFGPGVIDGSVPVVGGTLTDVSGTPFVFMKDQTRTVRYLSLQDEWALAPDWELTMGVRADNYSDFGDTVNPRLALVWATRHNLSTKLLYGRAFRAPSFGELFFINNPSLLGTPNLDPETIDTVELAFDYRPSFNLRSNLSLFRYEISDLIDFAPGPLGVTAGNSKTEQDGYGFEIEAHWNVNDELKLLGNYAWQHSENQGSGDRVADAPGRQAYISAHWNVTPLWSLDARLNWISGRNRSAVDLRDEIDDYTLVDLTLRRMAQAGNWEVALGVRNVFDEEAAEPSNGTIVNDHPLAGRSAFLEWRMHLQ